MPASSLKIGDELTTLDNKKVVITSIKDISLKNQIQVYNLEANTFKNFVIKDGVVVHNSDEILKCNKFLYPEYNPKLNKKLEIIIRNFNREYSDIPKDTRYSVLPKEYREAIDNFAKNNAKLGFYSAYRKFGKKIFEIVRKLFAQANVIMKIVRKK